MEPVTKLDPKADAKIRGLARLGRQVLEHGLRSKKMRARDRKLLQVVKQNWMLDAYELRSKILEVNENFPMDLTPSEIDEAIEKLI